MIDVTEIISSINTPKRFLLNMDAIYCRALMLQKEHARRGSSIENKRIIQGI